MNKDGEVDVSLQVGILGANDQLMSEKSSRTGELFFFL
jgi:hypothetical protein